MEPLAVRNPKGVACKHMQQHATTYMICLDSRARDHHVCCSIRTDLRATTFCTLAKLQ